MHARRHPIIPVAIAFAIVPGMIELANTLRAGLLLAGQSSGALRWVDPSYYSYESTLSSILRSRWPWLMLIVGLALLTRNARWAVPAAWAYVIVSVSTAVGRYAVWGFNAYAAMFERSTRLSERVDIAGTLLTFVLNQAMDLLPALLLLLAAKSIRRASMPAATAPATDPAVVPIATPATAVLAYRHGGEESNHSRWGLRLAFAVACVATLRLVVELVPLVVAFFMPYGSGWGWSSLPLYLFGPQLWMPIDAVSEYVLRIAWVLLLVGLWPSRRLVWSRSLVVCGCVAIALWAVLETTAVCVATSPNFIIAGHPASNVLSCIRIAMTELSIPAMILTLLYSPLP